MTRVKNLLTGLAANETEVSAVAADPAALAPLVRQWMKLPAYRNKMLAFFTTEFQQDDWTYDDLTYEFCTRIPFRQSHQQFVENMQQSFGRTVVELIDEGRPFTDVFTTTRFMMTPALMAGHALIDEMRVADHFFCDPRKLPFSITVSRETTTPLEDALTPGKAGFGHFRDSFEGTYPQGSDLNVLTDLLYGRGPESPVGSCSAENASYLVDSDFADWRMVAVRQPRPAEPLSHSYDLPSFRKATHLALEIPRVGFFTTPAFAARWPTNSSNQHRVTINQAMIVAFGKPIDLTNRTRPHTLVALDTAHASAETDCYDCHQSLDPMRQFFQQTYSDSFGLQRDYQRSSIPGEFAFQGVAETGTGIASLGAMLARHPLFARAWVQKACAWATSGPCDEHEPEFTRLVGLFEASRFSWPALMEALVMSPLVTGLGDSKAAKTSGQRVSIARREHLCAALSSRLGVEDACAPQAEGPPSREQVRIESRPAGSGGTAELEGVTPMRSCLQADKVDSSSRIVRNIARSWPSDRYGRGNAARSFVTSPSLLTRGGMENLCAHLAERFVDTDATPLFRSRESAKAIDNLVTRLMGLTTARAATPRTILQEHFARTRQRGATEAEALRSTFVLACLTPYVSGMGE